jgi:hypothetical protein
MCGFSVARRWRSLSLGILLVERDHTASLEEQPRRPSESVVEHRLTTGPGNCSPGDVPKKIKTQSFHQDVHSSITHNSRKMGTQHPPADVAIPWSTMTIKQNEVQNAATVLHAAKQMNLETPR